MVVFEKLLEKLYSFFIIDVIFLDRSCLEKRHLDIKQFSSITFSTTDNKTIKFKFSEIISNRTLLIRKFVAEVEASSGFTESFLELNDKVVIVFKIIIIPINYKILSRALYNVYVKHAYEYIAKKLSKQN
jgi:hypothetical protein